MILSTDQFNIPALVYEALTPANVHDFNIPLLSKVADELHTLTFEGTAMYLAKNASGHAVFVDYTNAIRCQIGEACRLENQWLFDEYMVNQFLSEVLDKNDEFDGDDDLWDSLIKGWLLAKGCPTDLLYEADEVINQAIRRELN